MDANFLGTTDFTRASFCAGAGTVGVKGVARFIKGAKQGNITEIAKGTIQTVMGITGTTLAYHLDSKIIDIALQAFPVTLPSVFIAKLGLYEVARGRYRPGVYKLLLGIGGIVSSAYYMYHSYAQKDAVPSDPDSLSLDPLGSSRSMRELEFLKSHKAEIEEMYVGEGSSAGRKIVGHWTRLGWGISRSTFIHPDMPGMLIKIPHSQNSDEFSRRYYNNLNQLQKIATSFDRIVLPKSLLYPTCKGLVILEQKFNLVNYQTVPDSPDKDQLMDQFYQFTNLSKICDVDPKNDHNAGILSQTNPLKIGIFDFDCIEGQPMIINPPEMRMPSEKPSPIKWRPHWNWNFKNPGSQFFQPTNRNQVSALFLAAGTALASAAASTVKKITGMRSRKILLTGLGIGVGASALLASFLNDLHQPAATMFVTSAAMTATAVVTLAAARAYCWAKNYLAPFVPV